MAAVQAYACASGKGKKPSRTTNALARRHQSVALARLQAHPQLELRGVHLSSDGPAGHQGLGSRLLVSRRTDVCAAGCADRAQEVDLAERGPVDVCEI